MDSGRTRTICRIVGKLINTGKQVLAAPYRPQWPGLARPDLAYYCAVSVETISQIGSNHRSIIIMA